MRRFVFVLCALGVVSCGRRATQADCDAILDRMVVVKLKERGVTDPDSVKKMQTELRKDAESDIPGCVGKRITDSAMSCIQKANTQEAIIKCLR